MDPTELRRYEVIGGPLDGEVVELAEGATEYVALRDGGRGSDTYRVEWWTKRDGDGRTVWEGPCLVWQEAPE